jgi:hypothetical protein
MAANLRISNLQLTRISHFLRMFVLFNLDLKLFGGNNTYVCIDAFVF